MFYLIRHHKKDHYDLAKFEENKSEPKEVYHVRLNARWCDCPSRQNPCKHIQWVLTWLKLENQDREVYLDAKTEEFHPYAMSNTLSTFLNKATNNNN